ncbi:MAG: YbaB/EbfC family nucleoid-associated protein [Deltaproteobacteria bacterium]|nr:YbaB/EbfC family nucleoid-associated protein [Deltaproteobacteria bacterium]
MNEILKQVQDIQLKVKDIQGQLAKRSVEAQAGGGMVIVKVNGRQELQEIKIDPVCVDSRDIPMLEDLILAAVNQGIKKSRELASEELKKLTGGIPLPFDLF